MTSESVLAKLISDMLVNSAPNVRRRSTGALRNSIHTEGNRIVVGGGNVDYAVYTNSPWISPKWHGAQNPNEAWADDTVIQGVLLFAAQHGYKVVFK